MALTKVSGSILKDPLNLGEVSIGGTLTYQDVTNVDAIGIGTFRSGINVSGGQLDVGSNIKIGNAGIITATELDISGDIDVDGHTNLDNVSITGVTTLSHTGANQLVIKDSDTSGTGSHMRISFQDSGGTEKFFVGNNNNNDYLYLGSGAGQANPTVIRYANTDKVTVENSRVYINTSLEVVGSITAADSIIHQGDTNTKMRFPSNDQISFETGGSERLRIRSDGNVGVGSDNPQAEFEVYGYGAAASGATPILAIRNGYAGTADTSNALSSELRFLHKNHNAAHEFMAARILAYTSDNYSQLTSLRFLVAQGNNGTERMRITSSGRVGINQTNPDRMLEVSNDDAPAAKFGGAGGGQDFAIEIGQLTSSSSPGLNATGGSAMLFTNNGTESMRLIASGSGGGVGIKTSNSGNAKSLNVYTPGSGDGKYAMQIENGYGSGAGGNILKLKSGRGDGTVDVDLIRMDLYNNTRIFSVDNSGLMRFRSGCGSGSQDALAVYGVRAWINFSSINNSIRGKGGLSGISDRGTGQFTYNFSTSLPDGNYTVTCNSGNSNSGTSNRNRMSAYSLTTANFKIDDFDSGAGNTPGYTDRQMVHVMVVR